MVGKRYSSWLRRPAEDSDSSTDNDYYAPDRKVVQLSKAEQESIDKANAMVYLPRIVTHAVLNQQTGRPLEWYPRQIYVDRLQIEADPPQGGDGGS